MKYTLNVHGNFVIIFFFFKSSTGEGDSKVSQENAGSGSFCSFVLGQ